MATQVTNYQCPACTGPLHYGAHSGKLECEYCGSSFDVAGIEEYYREKDEAAAQATDRAREKEQQAPESQWDTSSMSDQWGSDAEGMRVYNCPSCGAQLICEQTTAASACPYCGNPTVVPGQFSGVLKPDLLIPFRLTKDQAIAKLKEHYKGKPLLPRAFSQENHLKEIQGIYVPFWLFDGQAQGKAHFAAGRTRSYRSGDYRITETQHFDVLRAGSLPFTGIPVDGSSKMPDDYMDSLEPYDYGELKPFSPAYLPGYLADKYDVSAEDCGPRADRRAEATLAQSLRDSVIGYSSVIETSKQVKLHRGQVRYALLPVWLLHTRWQDKDYLFAMNGQTGKFVGDLPIDKKRKWSRFAAIYGIAAAATALITLFAGGLWGLLGL